MASNKKFHVRFTRTETYVYSRDVEAIDEDEARAIAEDESWKYPKKPNRAEEVCDVSEVGR